jgi:hypothetical protein
MRLPLLLSSMAINVVFSLLLPVVFVVLLAFSEILQL